MSTLIFIVHILLCIFLILLVLLQHGKGADAGALMGSGAESILGAGSAGSVISKLTTGIAIAFMLTSIILVHYSKDLARTAVKGRGTQVDVLKGSALDNIEAPAPLDLAPQAMPDTTEKESATPNATVAPTPSSETPNADQGVKEGVKETSEVAK